MKRINHVQSLALKVALGYAFWRALGLLFYDRVIEFFSVENSGLFISIRTIEGWLFPFIWMRREDSQYNLRFIGMMNRRQKIKSPSGHPLTQRPSSGQRRLSEHIKSIINKFTFFSKKAKLKV